MSEVKQSMIRIRVLYKNDGLCRLGQRKLSEAFPGKLRFKAKSTELLIAAEDDIADSVMSVVRTSSRPYLVHRI